MPDEDLELNTDDGSDENTAPSEASLPVALVIAVLIITLALGSYMLIGFVNARPVDLVQLAEDNELRLVEIFPRLGDVSSVSHEDSTDEYAIWRTYTVNMQKLPDVRSDRARELIRRCLHNNELVVKLENENERLDIISVSYLGYVTHRIELNLSTFVEHVDTVENEPLARIAIIVDDLGYSRKFIDEWFSINAPLTFAILPRLALGPKLAEEARSKGYEVIVHMPLQGNPEAPVSDGTLTTDMDDETLKTEFLKNIESVPDAIGVNNHQGSVFTGDYDAMSLLMDLLRERDLFFVDSRTSSASVVERVAEEIGVKYAVNSIFLDNIDEQEYVQVQIQKLINTAKKHGSAIGICHVNRKSSLEVCSRSLALFDAEEIELVHVSQLIQ